MNSVGVVVFVGVGCARVIAPIRVRVKLAATEAGHPPRTRPPIKNQRN
jgi:hypothetical protein